MCLRVSCRTPVLGPALGMAGVGLASALAGHAAQQTRRLLAPPGSPERERAAEERAAERAAAAAAPRPKWWPRALPPLPRPPLRRADWDAALLDAALGVALFRLAGGRFSSVMPSDLAAPGALGFDALPAAGGDYAGAGARRELLRIFRRDGCHHCGAG